jgi:chloramphenicol O-acetyltransferase
MPEAILFPIVVLKSFGKMKINENGKKTMPMSIHVHHGLVDGLHLGQFVDYFQEIINALDSFRIAFCFTYQLLLKNH